MEPPELETSWLPWPAFLEQHVQGKEGEHQFWSVFGDRSEIRLGNSPHSLVSIRRYCIRNSWRAARGGSEDFDSACLNV